MERLTQQDFNLCDNCSAGTTCEHFCDPSFPACGDKAIYDRLRTYEETGLEPEDIKKLCADDAAKFAKMILQLIESGGADHLLELVQAEKDGRLVVLPCKVGDTVYVIGNRRIVECCIDEAYLDDAKGLEYLVSFDCDSDCDGCPFNDWSQDYSGEYSCSGEYGQASIKGADFGKTVFLSREEAEAALEAKEGEQNETV